MKWVYFEQITVKSTQFEQNCVFLYEIDILMGGKWRQKFVQRKLKFLSSAVTSMYKNFEEPSPPSLWYSGVPIGVFSVGLRNCMGKKLLLSIFLWARSFTGWASNLPCGQVPTQFTCYLPPCTHTDFTLTCT